MNGTKTKEPYFEQKLKDEEMHLLRDYLAECRTATVELTKEVLKDDFMLYFCALQVSTEIEAACVQLRRDDKALTADDLHHRLTLAKLVAAAKGWVVFNFETIIAFLNRRSSSVDGTLGACADDSQMH